MKAIQLMAYGRSAQNLEYVDLPEPAAPDVGEALIDIEYAPINFNDLMVIWGTFPWHPETPAVIGNEGGGVVRAVGAGVTTVKPGDRVVLPLVAGSWRQRIVLPVSSLTVVPAEADSVQSALLGINPPTAALLLSEYIDLKEGDAIAFNAANSGLAQWLIALARQKKLRTVGLIRRASEIEAVKAMGVDFVVADDEPITDAKARLAELNIRLGLDVLGGAPAARVLGLLSYGGKLVNYGSVTEKPMEIYGGILTFNRITVEACFMGAPDLSAKAMQILPSLAEMLAKERIVQPVGTLYTLDRIHEAVEHATRGGRRVVLDITGTR